MSRADAVYVGSNDDTLYAVDAGTGSEEWSFTEPGQVISSPTVVDDPQSDDSAGTRVELGTLGHHHVWADQAPYPAFTFDPTDPVAGEEVTFDASGTVGDVASYEWDFAGDGATDATSSTCSRPPAITCSRASRRPGRRGLPADPVHRHPRRRVRGIPHTGNAVEVSETASHRIQDGNVVESPAP